MSTTIRTEDTPTLDNTSAQRYGQHDGPEGTTHNFRWVWPDGSPVTGWVPCTDCPTLADAARDLDVDEAAYVTVASEIAQDRLEWATPMSRTPISAEVAAEIADAIDNASDLIAIFLESVSSARFELEDARAVLNEQIERAARNCAPMGSIAEAAGLTRVEVRGVLGT